MTRTPKQEAFAQAIVSGKRPSEAYRVAYSPKGSPRRVSILAQKVLNHPLVQARIAELRTKQETPKTLDRQRKREKLAAMIEESVTSGKQLTSEQLRAIELDNRMAGHNEPDQVHHFGLSDLLELVRKGSKEAASDERSDPSDQQT